MKITVKKSELISALKKAKFATSRTFPALVCVLLDAADGMLKISSTDLERSVSVSIPCELSKPGKLLVSCDRMLAICGMMQDEISFESEKLNLLLESGPTKGKIFGLSTDEIPKVLSDERIVSGFKIEAASLLVSLDRVTSACAVIDNRIALLGVHFVARNGLLVIEASQGRSLHVSEIGIPASKIDAVIPSQSIRAIASIFQTEVLTIRFYDNRISISGDGTEFSTKLIESTFPNVVNLIPKPTNKMLCIDRGEALEALDFVDSAMSSLGSVKVVAEGNQATFSSRESEFGETQRTVEMKSKISAEFVCSIKYLSDAIKATSGSFVEIEYQGPVSPLCIRENGFTAVINPMRVNP